MEKRKFVRTFETRTATYYVFEEDNLEYLYDEKENCLNEDFPLHKISISDIPHLIELYNHKSHKKEVPLKEKEDIRDSFSDNSIIGNYFNDTLLKQIEEVKKDMSNKYSFLEIKNTLYLESSVFNKIRDTVTNTVDSVYTEYCKVGRKVVASTLYDIFISGIDRYNNIDFAMKQFELFIQDIKPIYDSVLTDFRL